MNKRDLLSTLGVVLYAIGKPLQTFGPTPTMHWIGQAMQEAGFILGVGPRAFMPTMPKTTKRKTSRDI